MDKSSTYPHYPHICYCFYLRLYIYNYNIYILQLVPYSLTKAILQTLPQILTKSPIQRATPHKWLNAQRGAKHLETADILPNYVQGGAKRNSPVANWWFDRHKICLKCKKSLDFKRFFLYQLYRRPMVDHLGLEPRTVRL